MRFGHSAWHWYDLIILGLAAVIAYPDAVLDWIGERTGKVFGWAHLVSLEIVTITLMFIAMSLLMPVYPRLHWWHPLAYIGLLGLFRFIRWFVAEIFGINNM